MLKKTNEIERFRNLKLHEEYRVDSELRVTRVPGGWIYQTWNGFEDENGCALSTVFVPYNKESLDNLVEDLINSLNKED